MMRRSFSHSGPPQRDARVLSLLLALMLGALLVLLPVARALAAPHAAAVMDARTGEFLFADNADTRLHPASLTKMMTLYIAFEAVEKGEIGLDTPVLISRHAAGEPPSKLGLVAGQRIALRYLIRAAAVKSANDAATAIGEAISGSEAAFARRMNRTAKALGMTRTTFRNAHGLTEEGHLSTARDMTILGRRVLYDYPEYYNLFSRLQTDAGLREVRNTNRRFLSDYRGADGIKTGYTSAAGFNLVASAERGQERIIATVFGGASTAARNAKAAELLDLGFRKAPARVAIRKPAPPVYDGTTRTGRAPVLTSSLRPMPRPVPAAEPVATAGAEPPVLPDPTLLATIEAEVSETLSDVVSEGSDDQGLPGTPPPPRSDAPETLAADAVGDAVADSAADLVPPAVDAVPSGPLPPGGPAPLRPAPRRITYTSAALDLSVPPQDPQVVRLSTATHKGDWTVRLGLYPTRDAAERAALTTTLAEVDLLGEGRREIGRSPRGWEARLTGLDRNSAQTACTRLIARGQGCTAQGPLRDTGAAAG